tara:strand:+ start:1107 stop:1295 length:189 start_codon:yes stop_codon:yes gene_type:complete
MAFFFFASSCWTADHGKRPNYAEKLKLKALYVMGQGAFRKGGSVVLKIIIKKNCYQMLITVF